MGARYPDQVGGHKPCVPRFVFELMSLFGTVFVFAMTVAVGSFGRHGATQD